MADNDQYNDEYQFTDLDGPTTADDGLTPDVGEETDATLGGANDTHPSPDPDQKNVKRNAMIVVGLVILVMILYKIIGSFFSEKPAVKPPVVPVVVNTAPVSVAPVVPQQPAPVDSSETKQVHQKLSDMELGQQTLRADVSSVSEQMGSVSSNLNAMVAKLNDLIGVITALSAKVDEQSRDIEQLTVRRRVLGRAHGILHKKISYTKYYIQAVIPGRAWLIASNGTTLTVREGSLIAGYGRVRLIDSNQGRVTTSSGQVIRFNQEDS